MSSTQSPPETPHPAGDISVAIPEVVVDTPADESEDVSEIKPDSVEPSTSTSHSNVPMKTPAPPRSGEIIVPDAPSHPPPAKGLPISTPSTSLTPTIGRSERERTQTDVDLTEFDPFATPSTSTASTSTPVRKTDEQQSASIPTTSASAIASGSGGETPRRTGSSSGQEPQEPSFNFSGFLKDLKLKSADPIARYLKSFLSNFAKKPFTVNEQVKLIHDFLAFISEKMGQVEPWKSQSQAEFENAMEAMEKLVMNRLYNYTFTPQLVPSQPITTDDLERDAVFSQRVRLFGWVREKHLDVPEGEASQGFLGFAEQELLKINHYKAPRDKMVCILNCCKVIFGLIRNAYGTESTGADNFVPILIFVVLRANPDNMLSNIEYISRFRSASKLQGETGYYLSSLTGAIQFIETMDASSLSNITQAEFEQNVEVAIQQLPPSPSTVTARPLPPTEMSPFAATSPGEEAARPLTLTTSLRALDGTKQFFQRTGNLAQEAVSKPLNAIGKILEGMQQGETGSEDGSPSPPQQQQQQQQAPSSTPRDVFGRTRRAQFNRAETPESPSRPFNFFGAAGLGGDDSTSISRAGTPTPEAPLPDFSSLQIQSTLDMSQETYAQTRRANVQTLHQMFPALDEEVVEAVLEGCGDDLGVAIDRLLEM
ncbi:hypothetical protein CI109_103598 [Kwoniella shandongensis]|uniref:Uncharacterized protein n=1 Tax=Kwoniella shandongensis TaxID=1734106 RepID=A0A5M6C7L7_9TREE|nr:uncharacterized protein CI109_000710 [Kwoniella shandongensis]KAA5531138.1 hypothetical protein CI109_000710 [Kwoniella shandongensis]